MLQVLIVFYVPGLLLGTPILVRFNAALIAFVINYACYFSEVFRGGIESISRSQYEAGQVLGMTKTQIFFRVILLQVIKRITAPMANEIITLVKDTALARVIMVIEIVRVAELIAATGIWWPLFYTGVFYLVFIGILTLLFEYAEKRMSYFRA
jgi:polar amino acid transport system permease protein